MTTEDLKTRSEGLGIYIHIPFCKKKCNYCDFLSFVPPGEDMVAQYVLGLERELELLASLRKYSQVVSVYLGGGTPSLLSSQSLRDIVLSVEKHFSFSPKLEFTLEANPGTLSRENLRTMFSLGINRLSFGVQSMEDKLLYKMGRLHNTEEAVAAFRLSREEGMGNISLDLMHGLPGQSLVDWKNTLTSVLQLGPEHISVYGLSVEENTPWGTQYPPGSPELPGEEECAQMYALSREMLCDAGFRQYEISNYAKPGYECRHNLAYWYREPYLGLGLGASSFIGETRYSNHRDLEAYLYSLEQGRLPVAEAEKISSEAAMSETMFLGLRTAGGVNLPDFVRQFGAGPEEVFFPAVGQLEKAGVLIREGHQLSLNPAYYAVSNEVFVKFI